MSVMYFGIAIAADSLWILALLFPVLVIMNIGVIKREEGSLGQKYGVDYRQYMSSVRRWL